MENTNADHGQGKNSSSRNDLTVPLLTLSTVDTDLEQTDALLGNEASISAIAVTPAAANQDNVDAHWDFMTLRKFDWITEVTNFFLPPSPIDDLSATAYPTQVAAPTMNEDAEFEQGATLHEQQESSPQGPEYECTHAIVRPLAVPINSMLGLNNVEFVTNAILLLVSSVALQVFYLWWGYVQELVMTSHFEPTSGAPHGRFPSAAFCVWVNRSMALFISAIVVAWQRWHRGEGLTWPFPRLRSYSPCAVSNALSSWCQYASLKYVSFPVQIMFKSGKLVAVMLVGRFLHGTRYSWVEYAESVLITTGVAVFSLTSRPNYSSRDHSGWLGYIFLAIYVFSDAFTSQWQEKIYQTYGRRNTDPFQMMLGVNLFGWMLTSIGLFLSGDIPVTLEFLHHNPRALLYLRSAGVASSLGQLTIFFVIREFGPIVFTIVMTTRQMIAMVLSVLVFGHVLPAWSLIGAAFVFGIICFQIWRNYTLARQPEVLMAG